MNGVPQYPWKEGDTVYASALNAAFANGSAIGGPYLSLPTGGTVAGPTTHNAPLNVTTTGATQSRSVQDRFAEVVDIQDYGQIGTGNAATDTATFLAAVAALPSNGGVLRIGSANPNGITLNQTITINKTCKIEGATTNGWCSSIVCLMSGPALLFSDPTPSLQKTFEVENIRFTSKNMTGPTESAIQVNVGFSTGQPNASFIGRNLTMAGNVANAAAPYAQTFTNGIEFWSDGSTPAPGTDRYWNVALDNVFILGAGDSGNAGAPIAGTAGIKFGAIVYATWRNVNISMMDSGLHQTAYCEGITCVSCQVFTVNNGWDMASFAPVGAAAVKLLQPVYLGGIFNALQSAVVWDCAAIGQVSNNYIQAAGATNIALSNCVTTQVCNNNLIGGTTGVALSRAGYNEGGNLVAANIMQNQTTHVSLSSGTFDSVLDNFQASGVNIVITDGSSGTNTIRNDYLAARIVGSATSTNTTLNLLGASGAWRNLEINTGTSGASGVRWSVGTGTTPEGGSNTGSNFQIGAYSDSGANLGTPLTITRATGAVEIWRSLGMANNVPLQLFDASGAPVQLVVGADNHFQFYSTDINGNPLLVYDFYAHTSTPNLTWRLPTWFANSVGFNGSAPTGKPTINGAWAGNTAGKALIQALAVYGLVTDNTSA